MALTQTELNNCFQRCEILKKMHHHITGDVILNIKNFFTKIRSLEKISNLSSPIEVEVDDNKQSVVFSWLKVNEESQIDTLDIYFTKEEAVLLEANYESKDIDISLKIPFDEDFHERIVVHLRHFKNKKRKKKYK